MDLKLPWFGDPPILKADAFDEIAMKGWDVIVVIREVTTRRRMFRIK